MLTRIILIYIQDAAAHRLPFKAHPSCISGTVDVKMVAAVGTFTSLFGRLRQSAWSRQWRRGPEPYS
jgi:hypothetical protein